MKRREFLQMSLWAGAAAGVSVTARSQEPRRPNVLWVFMDDCRPDAIGCYGQPWAHTPHLDGLARRGVRFENMAVQCPICVPSRTSLKTSRYAHETQVMYMGKPPAETPPYAHAPAPAFKNLLTAWPDSGIPLNNVGKRHAYIKDWDHLGDPRPKKTDRKDTGKTYPEVNLTTHGWRIGGTIDTPPDCTRPGQIGQHALDALKKLTGDGAPFFLRVGFHAPHVPIRVPPSFMVDPESVDLPYPTEEELRSKPRFEREQLRIYAGTTDLSREQVQIARGTYYGMVSLADEYMAGLFEQLETAGLLEDTIVAFNSDHGLQLGEHGLHKKRNFYEQTILTPMIFSWPGRLPQDTVLPQPAEMLDFVPTLMDLCGFEQPEGVRGRSLAPLMRGETTAHRDAVFSEIDQSGSMYDELRVDSGRRVMVRTPEWKLIYFKDPRVKDKDGALYHLSADPGETENLYGDPQHADVVARLEAMADDWDRETAMAPQA